jgi:hypothetical protein
LEAELRDGPELLAVRGDMLLELAVCQPPAQPGFADARIADQDEFGRGVVDTLLCLAERNASSNSQMRMMVSCSPSVASTGRQG